MRHMLMDPAYPDIVGEWAGAYGKGRDEQPLCESRTRTDADDIVQAIIIAAAMAEVAATRVW